MAEVVGVVFSSGVKVYHFDPAGLELVEGDHVVVQTSSGPEIGKVVERPHEIDDSELAAALKKVQRVATDKDFETQAVSEKLRREAMATCRELIRSHGLDMKLVGAEVGFGGEKATFSFFSEERVDFRALVADLSKALKMRIELRQVGAREEARVVGGLGPCGRALCCTVFPGDDDPVSIRMAKEQNLPLNPTKISGLCGRLMCCLKYEQDQYVGFRKESPAKGTRVCLPEGDGAVSGYLVTKDALAVKMEDGTHTEVRLCHCECQKDGSLLVVVPEEKPPMSPLWERPVGLGGRSSAGEDTDVPPQSTIEDRAGAGGQGGSGDGGDGGGARPARSRRSRSKRKSRSSRTQGQAKTSGKATGGDTTGQAGGDRTKKNGSAGEAKKTPGQQNNSQRKNEGGSKQSQTRRSRRRKPRKPGESTGGQASGGQGSSGSSSGAG